MIKQRKSRAGRRALSTERKAFLGVQRKSQYEGVSWSKWDAKWQAYYTDGGKLRHLGLFDDEEEAARARDAAVIAAKLIRQLNFPLKRQE